MPSMTRVLLLLLSLAAAQTVFADGHIPRGKFAVALGRRELLQRDGTVAATDPTTTTTTDPVGMSQGARHRARKARRDAFLQKAARRSHGGRRMRMKRDEHLCPQDLTACPLSGFSGGDYECLDLSFELQSCGACGRDCTQIEGVLGVGCRTGACVAFSCQDGYTLRRGRCLAV